MLYIVTARGEKNPAHNPRAKVTGTCQVGSETCTDTTGEHHSFLVDSEATLDEVREFYAGKYHVTRVETATHVEVL